jgi:hypothetical protein
MGFLRKAFKKVKKNIKKVIKSVKKQIKRTGKFFKKLSKSKILKTIALVGAAIVTGGAAVGAFGGQLASSTMGTWLTTASSKILATPVIGTLAKPFQLLGSAVGASEVGKVYDVKTGKLLTGEQMAEIGLGAAPQQTSSNVLRTVGTGLQLASDIGDVYQKFQDPQIIQQGDAADSEIDQGGFKDPLQVSYAQPAVNLADAYSNLQFGTADPGYLAANLYRQETVGGMA